MLIFLEISYYTSLTMFVHGAKQRFWTWVQFPSSPPLLLGPLKLLIDFVIEVLGVDEDKIRLV